MSLAINGIENGALRAYIFSFAGHLLLALLVFLLPAQKSRVFVEEIPRSVRLVATLEEPAKPAPPKAAAPPRPAPRPAPKPAPRPAAPKPVPIPPRPVKPKMTVRDRTVPPPPKPPAPAASNLKETLSSRLSSLESAPAEAPPPTPPPVNLPKVAPLTVPTLAAPAVQIPQGQEIVALSDFPYSWYTAIVKDRIYQHWNPPSGIMLGGGKVVAQASFRILRNGKTQRVTLNRSSGHRLFDQSVLAALASVAVLPPLPEDYKEDYLDVLISFQNPNR